VSRVRPAIRGLIFDFDGLILETEEPDYQAWQEVYSAFGCTLPLAKWATHIGTAAAIFNPYDELEAQLGRPVDRAAIRAQRRRRFADLVAARAVLPGVLEYLTDAERLGLRLGVASSSSREWVVGHLGRLGLTDRFAAIACADEVSHTKPDPALYLVALTALDLRADEAIALEDSPNGIAAAKRAGLYCVAVPNALTRHLPLEAADLRLASLADLPLSLLVEKIQQGQDGVSAYAE
jgi:HAD superfamily hydrolase (TIGR01509 family)